MTLQELAEHLCAHRQTVYGWLRPGEITGRLTKVGTQPIWLVSRAGARDEPIIERQYDNMIELAVAKLKAVLRSAAARTTPDLWVPLTGFSPRFTPRKCRNYLTAAGYEDNLAVAS